MLAGGVQRMDSSGTKIRGIPFFPFPTLCARISLNEYVFNIGENNLLLAYQVFNKCDNSECSLTVCYSVS